LLESKSRLGAKCKSDNSCCDGFWYKTSIFEEPKRLYGEGHKCKENNECFSGNCVDDVCVDVS
jgi:hypothetical protein